VQQNKSQGKQVQEKDLRKVTESDAKSSDGGTTHSASSSITMSKDQYAEVICYNCGELGHHKAACTLPKT
jgi:hypothetical protein